MAKENMSDTNSSNNKNGKNNNIKKNKNNHNNNYKANRKTSFDSVNNVNTNKKESNNFSSKNDKSFLEQKTEILDVEEFIKASDKLDEIILDDEVIRLKNVIFYLGLVVLILIIFFIFHYITFDHTVKVVEKEVIKEVKVVDDNYLFLGDSITEWYDLDKYYGNLPIINSGIAGYTTTGILGKLDTLVYQYNPSKVFLLIGTNDLELKTSNEEIVDNIKKIIKNIKNNRPYSKIYLESIYPINNSNDKKIDKTVINGNRHNEDIIEINKMLVELAKEEGLVYINMYDELLDEDGLLKLEYTVDGLHISDVGYEKITDILMEYVKE